MAGPLPQAAAPCWSRRSVPTAGVATIEPVIETRPRAAGHHHVSVPRPGRRQRPRHGGASGGGDRLGWAPGCCATMPPTARRSRSRSACWPPTPTSPASASSPPTPRATCATPPCRPTAPLWRRCARRGRSPCTPPPRRSSSASSAPGPTIRGRPGRPTGAIAFARGNGGRWVVATAPGPERRILASGIQPVWVSGGGARRGSLARPAARRERVRIRLAGAPRGARAGFSGGRAGFGGRWSRPPAPGTTFRLASPRPRRAARAGSGSGRADDGFAAAPLAGSVAPAFVNGGWVGVGFDRFGGGHRPA